MNETKQTQQRQRKSYQKIEDIKKKNPIKTLQLKNAITEMKKLSGWGTKEQISKLKVRKTGMTQSEQQGENRLEGGRNEQSLRDLWDCNKGSNIGIIRFLEEEEKQNSTGKVLDFLINKNTSSLYPVWNRSLEKLYSHQGNWIFNSKIPQRNLWTQMEFHWRILPNTEGKINISSTWSLPENWAFPNVVYKASITLISVGDLRDLGDDKKKWYNHKGNNNVSFIRLCLNRIACEGLGMRPTRGLWQEGHHPEGEGGKGRPRGKGDQRGLRVYMNDVTQQHSGECLGQRTLKGSSL